MITYAIKSMPGKRDHNEDYVKFFEDGSTKVFALADGLGGHGYGEVASETAVESISSAEERFDGDDFLSKAFENAQEAVLQMQEKKRAVSGMATTLVVLRLTERYAQWAHIGDSRLYWFHGWFLKDQTLDHSVPQMLVRLGEIRPEQIRHHADRNRLLRVIGVPWDQQGYEVSDRIPLRRGDSFLLCSDGFWEYITEREMCRCLMWSGSAQGWLDRMVNLVEKNGAGADMDNYSAICVKVR